MKVKKIFRINKLQFPLFNIAIAYKVGDRIAEVGGNEDSRIVFNMTPKTSFVLRPPYFEENLEHVGFEITGITSSKEPFQFFHNTNFPLLKQQKEDLIQVMSEVKDVNRKNNLQGILNLIDSLQDFAVEVVGIDEDNVFSND